MSNSIMESHIYHFIIAQVGLVRMCAFMLQTLSSNRLFGVKINKSFDGHASLPASSKIPNFQGTYADYLILVCIKKKEEEEILMIIIRVYFH